MPFKGSVPFAYNKDYSKLRTITLREAAKTRRDKLQCVCTKGCKDKHCPCRAAGFPCSSHCHPKVKSCANQMESSDSSCTITGFSKIEKSTTKQTYRGQARPKIGKVPAKKVKADENLLEAAVKQGKWFDDQHINKAMEIIHSQFPSLAGLYNCLLGQNLSFPVTIEAFVQILHVEGNHWVSIEHTSSDCVNIYDSVHTSVSTDTKLQIASLLHTASKRITLKIQKVQFQKGASDCGAYSIAFATDLAFGNSPATLEYEQSKLRSHFLECLSKRHIVPFPSKPIKPGKPKSEYIYVFCTCRMPAEADTHMTQCTMCKEWYHKSCEHIPDSVFEDTDCEWKCTVCLKMK